MILLALYVLALIVFMIITEHAYRSALTSCGFRPTVTQLSACSGVISGAKSHASYVVVGLQILPLLIALILGTPLIASELEAKTNRLAWAQGVTRTRWLLMSWLTLVMPVVIAMSLLALTVQWWLTHVHSSDFVGTSLIQSNQFSISGVAPIAAAVFALSFGACVGALWGRISWSVAATFVGLWLVLGVMMGWVVPSLAPQVAVPLSAAKLPSSLRWQVSAGFRRSPGVHVGFHASSVQTIVQRCTNIANSSPNMQSGGGNESLVYLNCLKSHGVQAVNFYQPASHYWILQWREAGVYLVLVAALLGLSVWVVRRRRA
jgi:hypothetical protein